MERNTELEVRIGPRRRVACRSRRRRASLDWKIALLDHHLIVVEIRLQVMPDGF